MQTEMLHTNSNCSFFKNTTTVISKGKKMIIAVILGIILFIITLTMRSDFGTTNSAHATNGKSQRVRISAENRWNRCSENNCTKLVSFVKKPVHSMSMDCLSMANSNFNTKTIDKKDIIDKKDTIATTLAIGTAYSNTTKNKPFKGVKDKTSKNKLFKGVMMGNMTGTFSMVPEELVFLHEQGRNETMEALRLRVIAYHEAGHAVTAWFLQNSGFKLQYSIVSKGPSPGVTVYEDHNYTKTDDQGIHSERCCENSAGQFLPLLDTMICCNGLPYVIR